MRRQSFVDCVASAIASLILMTMAANVRAETVVLTAVAAGGFEESGRGGTVPNGSYFAGQGVRFGDVQRNVFVFDVSGVEDTIVAARLRVFNPVGGFSSPNPGETYGIFAVSSDPATLARGAGGVLAQHDVGSGIQYGSVIVTAASNGAFVEVDLVGDAIRGLNRAPDLFVLGGNLTSVDSSSPGIFLFGFSFRPGTPRPELIVETDPAQSLPAARVIHVDAAAGGGIEDGSASNPYHRIEEAIDASTSGDEVLVTAGRYDEAVVMRDGVHLRGAGPDTTVIDGNGRNVGVRCPPNGTLEGFQVTNVSSSSIVDGRAIECLEGSRPLILGNRISGNRATGIHLWRSAAAIRDNEIDANPVFGGSCPCDGILGRDSTPTINGNQIDGSGQNVAAIDLGGSRWPTGVEHGFRIERNWIVGPIRLGHLSEETNGQNLIVNNSLRSGGLRGATISVAFSPDAGLIANNTSIGGSGFFFQGDSSATVANNIIAFGNQGLVSYDEPPIVRNNNIFGNQEFGVETNYVGFPDLSGSEGNISADPLLADPYGGDLRLLRGSPSIDAGLYIAAAGDVDLDGSPRVFDGNGDGLAAPDMGALEFLGPLVVTIGIDIKPASDANLIDQTSRAPIPVAILGSPDFDPGELDATTLAFGPGAAAPIRSFKAWDANRDGFLDRVFQFRSGDIGLVEGDTEACITGAMLDGTSIEGCDMVRIRSSKSCTHGDTKTSESIQSCPVKSR